MKTTKKTVFVTGGSGFVGKNLIPTLIEKGYTVKALARSERALSEVKKLGAIPVKGDLENFQSLGADLQDCDSVFHLAASVDFFASIAKLKKLHVDATANLLNKAKEFGVRNFIYLGAASVAMNGKPLYEIDESFVSDNLTDGYSRTKFEAEQLVLAANSPNFRTISLRPPLIWGKGDPNTLPAIVDAIRRGQMMLIDGGKHRFVTCNIVNVCHALILADNSEVGGKAYFITDLETPVFREFMQEYVSSQDIQLPEKSISLSLARFFATIMEWSWRILPLKGNPPLYNGLVNVLGLEFTVKAARAKNELNYVPIVSIAAGMKHMRV